MTVKDYRELRVYQLAKETAMHIFELSKRFPMEERFSLTDHVRRSSRSVCANIAEAWRKRRYPASFVSKLSDSDSEAAETQVWLEFASECKYMDHKICADLILRYDHVCAQLTKVINNADGWTASVSMRK